MSGLRISKEALAQAESRGRASRPEPKDPEADRLRAVEIQQKLLAGIMAEIRDDLAARRVVRYEVLRGADGLISAVEAVRK